MEIISLIQNKLRNKAFHWITQDLVIFKKCPDNSFMPFMGLSWATKLYIHVSLPKMSISSQYKCFSVLALPTPSPAIPRHQTLTSAACLKHAWWFSFGKLLFLFKELPPGISKSGKTIHSSEFSSTTGYYFYYYIMPYLKLNLIFTQCHPLNLWLKKYKQPVLLQAL